MAPEPEPEPEPEPVVNSIVIGESTGTIDAKVLSSKQLDSLALGGGIRRADHAQPGSASQLKRHSDIATDGGPLEVDEPDWDGCSVWIGGASFAHCF